MKPLQDLNVEKTEAIRTPFELKDNIPASDFSKETVAKAREDIQSILEKKDKRFLALIGPCSIHDEKSALEYAERLNILRKKYEDKILIVMRVYFEKPRTTVGWKGLINDPHMNGSYSMNEGLEKARKLATAISEMGLPIGTEFLDPITPQYIADLMSWAAVGARTTESQTHREMASGLSMPVGFKNGTDGSVMIALNALESARSSHRFLGVDQEGHICTVTTRGNPWGHIILRGGNKMTNYDEESIKVTEDMMVKGGFEPMIVVDCSHANSGKKFEMQEVVWKNIVSQRISGKDSLIGVMLESHLNEGNQKIPEDLSTLEYGVSVTDECLGFEKTEALLKWAYEVL